MAGNVQLRVASLTIVKMSLIDAFKVPIGETNGQVSRCLRICMLSVSLHLIVATHKRGLGGEEASLGGTLFITFYVVSVDPKRMA